MATRRRKATRGTGRAVGGLVLTAAVGCTLIGTLVGLSAPASAAVDTIASAGSAGVTVTTGKGKVADIQVSAPAVKVPSATTPPVTTPSAPAVSTDKPSVPTVKPSVPSADTPSVSAPVVKPPKGGGVTVGVDPGKGVDVTIGDPDHGSSSGADEPADGAGPASTPGDPSAVSGGASAKAEAGTSSRGHRRHAESVVALQSGVMDGGGVTAEAGTEGESGTVSEQLVSAAHSIGPANGGLLLLLGIGWVAWTVMARRRRLARAARALHQKVTEAAETGRSVDGVGFLAAVEADLARQDATAVR